MIADYGNEIAERAGWLLEKNHPGPNKAKRIARLLDVSPKMAQLLMSGQGWTASRLNQVWKLYGRDFVGFVFGGEPGMPAMDLDLQVIKSDLAALKARLGVDDEGTGGGDAVLPSMARTAEPALGELARRPGGVLEGASEVTSIAGRASRR